MSENEPRGFSVEEVDNVPAPPRARVEGYGSPG